MADPAALRVADPGAQARGRSLNLPDDFRDLLVCLVDAEVEFVLIGGFAVAFHGNVRATKDIDVFVRADRANAVRIVRALGTFGAPLRSLGVSEEDFVVEGRVVQIGVPPLRVDLVTSISGIDYAAAAATPGTFDVDGRTVRVIGLEALLRNKRAAARPQDLADVDALERKRGPA